MKSGWHTLKIGTCAECSPAARDDPYPEAFVLIKQVPDRLDLLARDQVDTVQLLWSVQRDQENSIVWKRYKEILIMQRSRF